MLVAAAVLSACASRETPEERRARAERDLEEAVAEVIQEEARVNAVVQVVTRQVEEVERYLDAHLARVESFEAAYRDFDAGGEVLAGLLEEEMRSRRTLARSLVAHRDRLVELTTPEEWEKLKKAQVDWLSETAKTWKPE